MLIRMCSMLLLSLLPVKVNSHAALLSRLLSMYVVSRLRLQHVTQHNPVCPLANQNDWGSLSLPYHGLHATASETVVCKACLQGMFRTVVIHNDLTALENACIGML